MDERVPHWAQGVSRIAALTGAGISTDSGIPDYRGPEGVWTRDPGMEELFTHQRYVSDGEVRRRFWQTRGGLYRPDARPNAAHRALAELEATGSALRILTQNVDGLHQKAGSTPRKVLELHGGMATVICLRCGAKTSTDDALARVEAGEADPACHDCGGILQPSIIMFGQLLDQAVLAHAAAIARASQLFLSIGSSLMVEPAAGLCRVAVESGARLVIVNRDPTPYDDLATEIIREPIGDAVPRLCAMLAADAQGSAAARP
ncbi:SIR2 family NAD-dependent protein deacylase [Actinomadura sp. HBU206391]|uniref:SIR2 family NAD-dependent protein deacylase n=1 Tax=Actinomadura sp. HBU206391 TaxID=2731692 RepID=UPI00164EEF6B|nr:Sir2 family NAD-dependent protein deacetylase [Actinomadura sp. HBU206391]MBC6460646.1 NAD-dependent deacetylase [Actinomadura sp. HBU206391]